MPGISDHLRGIDDQIQWNTQFLEDINPLIPADINYDPVIAADMVLGELIAKLPGEPWKGTSSE